MKLWPPEKKFFRTILRLRGNPMYILRMRKYLSSKVGQTLGTNYHIFGILK